MGQWAKRSESSAGRTTLAQQMVEASLAETALCRDLHDCYVRLEELVHGRHEAEIPAEAGRAESLVQELRLVAERLAPVRAGGTPRDGAAGPLQAHLVRLWGETGEWLQKAVDQRARLLATLASACSETQQALSALGGAHMALVRYRSPAGRPTVRLQCRRV